MYLEVNEWKIVVYTSMNNSGSSVEVLWSQKILRHWLNSYNEWILHCLVNRLLNSDKKIVYCIFLVVSYIYLTEKKFRHSLISQYCSSVDCQKDCLARLAQTQVNIEIFLMGCKKLTSPKTGLNKNLDNATWLQILEFFASKYKLFNKIENLAAENHLIHLKIAPS